MRIDVVILHLAKPLSRFAKRRSTRMGALVSALPCVPARETNEEESKPSEEPTNEDEDPALATLDAYLALEERRRASRRTSASSSRGRRDRAESVATSTLDAYDSGAVEIAACRLRSARVMREQERDARRAFERETGEARLKASDSRASERRKGEKERFAVALYCRHAGPSGGGEAGRSGGDGGSRGGRVGVTDGGGRAMTNESSLSKWIGLGRRACEPCRERDGNLLPLWGKEESREVALARNLICAPKWTAPNGTDASSTMFHLVLSELPSSTHAAVVKESDVKHALEEKNDLDSVKGRMIGDAKFTLLDLLLSLDRRLDVVVVANTDAHGGVAVPVAKITLALTPPEVSRAWNAHRTGGADSQIGHLREACASSALSFEVLFDQYENHLFDSNAIASVEHHRRRQARIISSKVGKDLTEKFTGGHYRLAGLEDVRLTSDAASVAVAFDAPTRSANRTRPIRNANRRRRTDDNRSHTR